MEQRQIGQEYATIEAPCYFFIPRTLVMNMDLVAVLHMKYCSRVQATQTRD